MKAMYTDILCPGMWKSVEQIRLISFWKATGLGEWKKESEFKTWG